MRRSAYHELSREALVEHVVCCRVLRCSRLERLVTHIAPYHEHVSLSIALDSTQWLELCPLQLCQR